ncbi:uncharacterized protein LOC126736595 [Anthonomus grandis grandis]|uniref:uncharacterized protein LOC126736595 n=1 Tax=Anthonomus grandis grandis TaxID=2921223 RepID=UPI002166957F|nr:uncharacterized protein LOC126736595 [Anthonomus grandis grandis]
MRRSLVIYSVLLLLSSALSTDNINEELLTNEVQTLTWTPKSDSPLIIKADEGYQIQVEATQLDIDGESGDYVTVKNAADDVENDDALIFSYTVSGKPSYLYNSNKLQVEYSGSNSSNTFSLKFTRVGEAATTTKEPSSTTTTELMPTAAPEEEDTLTVYLLGKSSNEFVNSALIVLKQAICDMGKEYCRVQKCPINGTITAANVKIENLEPCPIAWPNSAKCVTLTFALPIVKLTHYEDEQDLWKGYMLSRKHLSILWQTYAETYVQEAGLNVYSVPDVTHILTYRIIVTSCIIVALVAIILIAKRFVGKLSTKRRKLSDTISIMGQPSNRPSQVSLTPHYLQALPPLFSNDFQVLFTEQKTSKNYSDFDNTNFSETTDISDQPSSAPPLPEKLNMGNDLIGENEA